MIARLQPQCPHRSCARQAGQGLALPAHHCQAHKFNKTYACGIVGCPLGARQDLHARRQAVEAGRALRLVQNPGKQLDAAAQGGPGRGTGKAEFVLCRAMPFLQEPLGVRRNAPQAAASSSRRAAVSRAPPAMCASWASCRAGLRLLLVTHDGAMGQGKGAGPPCTQMVRHCCTWPAFHHDRVCQQMISHHLQLCPELLRRCIAPRPLLQLRRLSCWSRLPQRGSSLLLLLGGGC